MTKAIVLAALGIFATCGAALSDDTFADEFLRYFQRIETISVASGDARQVNAVTHIIDPWPPYVGNRRLRTNAERMVGAYDRYKNPRKLGITPPTIAPVILPTVGSGGGSSGGMGGGMGYGGGSDGGQ